MTNKCAMYYHSLMYFLSAVGVEDEFTKKLNNYRQLTVNDYVEKCFCEDDNNIENAISMAFSFNKFNSKNYCRWRDIDRKWRKVVLNSASFKSMSKGINTVPKHKFKSIW